MKINILIFVTFIYSVKVFAQKKALQLDSYKTWTEVDNGGLSNDGRFAYYQIKNQPINSNTIVLTKTEKKKKWEFIGMTNPAFCEDSRTFVGTQNDSLVFFNLSDSKKRIIAEITSYKLFMCNHKDFIIYQEKHSNDVHIKEVYGNYDIHLKDAIYFNVSPNGSSVIVKQKLSGNENKETVSFVDIKKKQAILIHIGNATTNFIFDNYCKKIAFWDRLDNNNRMYFYSIDSTHSTELINNNRGIDSGFFCEAGNNWRFTTDGRKILFSQTENSRNESNDSNPEVWNTKDLYLVSHYKNKSFVGKMFGPRQYLSAISIDTKVVNRMLKGDDVLSPFEGASRSDYFIIESDFKIQKNVGWNEFPKRTYSVLNINTGDRRIIKRESTVQLTEFSISPEKEYLVFYDPEKKNYSYLNLKTFEQKTLTGNVNKSFTYHNAINLFRERFPSPIIGWLNNNSVLISDSYDIWLFNLSANYSPINITRGIGVKKNVIFWILDSELKENANQLILKGFNENKKELEFYLLKLTNALSMSLIKSPIKYISGSQDCMYSVFSKSNFFASKYNKSFLIRCETAKDAPNYFFCKNLNSPQKISDNHPEKDYNWLSTELHVYKDSSGRELNGILYKPENFDSTRKYPLIYNYYITHSNELNEFSRSNLSSGDIDVSYLVSNGFLVFRPDMILKPENSGDCVVNCIHAAIDHLSKFAWYDENRIALSGHSVGGWETNYIITHSNRKFAAAVSASGVSNLTNHVSSLWPNGNTEEIYVRYGPYMINQSLSDNSNLYIRNSPIFYCKNVKTPLLLMHNYEDKSVEFSQSRSFFTQLRSLDKAVWMISYQDEGHILMKEKNRIDYTIKLCQFLCHYLKEQPTPDWMQREINSNQ